MPTTRPLAPRVALASAAVAIAQALCAFDPALQAQASAERSPKTAAELQRQSGHIWDLAPPARVAAVRPLSDRAFRRALAEHRAGTADLRHDLDVSWGEFVSGTGKPFLAVALDRPLDGELAAGTAVTVFGEIVDAADKPVASFEADGRIEAVAGRALVDLSLPLPDSTAKAYLGIAANGRPRWLTEVPMQVRAIDQKSFGLSRPILSLDVHPLAEAQGPDDPFRFGGLRVAPRGDRAFRAADAPWLFVVVRTPASPDGGPPALTADLLVSAPDGGHPQHFAIADPSPTPLRGFYGQWGLGIPLPVSALQPGDYRASLSVTDRQGAHATAESTFRVVAH